MPNNIRERLKAAGKTQVWMIKELVKRGINTTPQEFSTVLTGLLATPKARKIIQTCGEILDSVNASHDEGAD